MSASTQTPVNSAGPPVSGSLSKHAAKRTAAQRAKDLGFVEHHHLRGKTHAEIATMLCAERTYTISRQQVAYDLKQLEGQWKEEAKQHVDVAKARAYKSLATQERVAWEGFEKTHNPVFLKLLLEIHDRRMKLLGLDVPEVTVTGQKAAEPSSVQTIVSEHDQPITEAELERVIVRSRERTARRQLAQKLGVSPFYLERYFEGGESRPDNNGPLPENPAK